MLSLDTGDRLWLARILEGSPEEIRVTASILQPLVDDNTLSDEDSRSVRSKLALAYIGSGECARATKLLSDRGLRIGNMVIQDAFNDGMAMWGDTCRVVLEPYVRTVELDRADQDPPDNPNYSQCMAVAYWACGDVATALEFIRKARATMDRKLMKLWGTPTKQGKTLRDEAD